ncbi:Cytochrome P450 family protein [Hirschfeldia incana]|nr:Cytochrome P450 family protein [Hirschfeldia incana]
MASQGIVSLAKSLSILTPRVRLKTPETMQNLKRTRSRHLRVCCSKLSQWGKSPFIHDSTEEAGGIVIEKNKNVFESIVSDTDTEDDEKVVSTQLLRWPIWLLGPSVLLTTGMAPTLWLPLSSVYVGSKVVSVLSLIGLDCIFNLGATLFLLMADSCARHEDPSQPCKSQPPFSYKFWNVFALLTGFLVPTLLLLGSQTGLLASLQPELPFLSVAVLLFPYFILLAVQTLTEILTWNWQSPVWLVTPVVYEAYRILQLMRGLKLSAEVNAPVWVVHMIRGLVSWWVLILGMQLMRVAWFAGFASRTVTTTTTAQPESSVASK